jgi:DNA-directed RNA polymerase specialized sigma24 family protein
MGVDMEDLPDQMSLTALANRCMSEIENYRRKESYNDLYCLEIFHRALLQRDNDAWNLLVDRFSPMVRSWVRSHPRRDAACRHDSEENYVSKTFGRFWQAAAYNQAVRFTSLAAALSYLKTCLTGTILDTLRSYARADLSLNDPDHPIAEEPAVEDDTDDGHELWNVISSLLPNAREQRLAYLLFHCGLKAREVVQFCGQEFSDVNEVYRLRRNIIERLMRNKDQIRWRLGSEES